MLLLFSPLLCGMKVDPPIHRTKEGGGRDRPPATERGGPRDRTEGRKEEKRKKRGTCFLFSSSGCCERRVVCSSIPNLVCGLMNERFVLLLLRGRGKGETRSIVERTRMLQPLLSLSPLLPLRILHAFASPPSSLHSHVVRSLTAPSHFTMSSCSHWIRTSFFCFLKSEHLFC